MNTNNPREGLNKLINMTNDYIRGILVRCCGFHKVESSVNKTITTSTLRYEEDFSEYMKKGWSISFIPPIIIQRDLGEISVLNTDSYFVKKYIKKW